MLLTRSLDPSYYIVLEFHSNLSWLMIPSLLYIKRKKKEEVERGEKKVHLKLSNSKLLPNGFIKELGCTRVSF